MSDHPWEASREDQSLLKTQEVTGVVLGLKAGEGSWWLVWRGSVRHMCKEKKEVGED